MKNNKIFITDIDDSNLYHYLNSCQFEFAPQDRAISEHTLISFEFFVETSNTVSNVSN